MAGSIETCRSCLESSSAEFRRWRSFPNHCSNVWIAPSSRSLGLSPARPESGRLNQKREWRRYRQQDLSLADEGQNIDVDDFRVARGHPVRKIGIGLERAVLQQLGSKGSGRRKWHNLIIFAVKHEDRHID